MKIHTVSKGRPKVDFSPPTSAQRPQLTSHTMFHV